MSDDYRVGDGVGDTPMTFEEMLAQYQRVTVTKSPWVTSVSGPLFPERGRRRNGTSR